MPGQVHALLGPNGAGKTTTIECCLGLSTPTAGSIRVLTQHAPVTAEYRAQIGAMLQDGGLPGAAKPLDFLRHLSTLYAQPRGVDQLTELLALHDFARTPIRRLSGGQRQRVALAAALIPDPALVFLDEPSAGLDVQARRAVWETISQLADNGTAVVLTTHDMNEAASLAHHITIVDEGLVVAQGTLTELTSNAGVVSHRLALTVTDQHSRQTHKILTDATGMSATQRAEPGVAVTLTATGAIAPSDVAAILLELDRQNINLVRCTFGQQSLEDLFLALTGRNLR